MRDPSVGVVLEPSKELAAMMDAAQRAGSGLMRRFHERPRLRVRLKGPADFVSTADLESEKTLRSLLLRAHPKHGVLAEESAPRRGTGSSRFIVDPLDGTTNFLHGIPHFAIAIAFEREGRVVAGVVFDPPKGEMFVAEQGRGAWLGRKRMRVSNEADLSRTLVGTGIPHCNRVRSHARYLAMLAATMRKAAGIRRFSAAALDLAYVASGRFAAFFELGLALWDFAAGALLVREAGGRVSEPDGGDAYFGSGDILATNGRLHEPMLELFRRAAGRDGTRRPRPRTRSRA